MRRHKYATPAGPRRRLAVLPRPGAKAKSSSPTGCCYLSDSVLYAVLVVPYLDHVPVNFVVADWTIATAVVSGSGQKGEDGAAVQCGREITIFTV